MSTINYPAVSFEKMNREQAVTTCYALEDQRDRALTQVAELTEMLTAATDTAVQRGKRIDATWNYVMGLGTDDERDLRILELLMDGGDGG